jgi:ATP-binding cassette, subfamily B, multidrug efflux pump
MQYRLERRFVPWLIFHTIEFWYHYLGAIFCLYMLHYYQSEIPRLAKDLGDLVSKGALSSANIWYFLFLAIAILFFRTFSRLLFFYPARIQQKYLRIELVDKLEKALPDSYQKYNEGQLFQTIYNDLNRIRGFVGFALLQLGNILIAAFIFIPKIREFNPDFLIAFSPMVLCIVIFTTLIYFMQPVMAKGMDLAGEVQNFLIESYDAKKTIKNFHAEKAFIRHFEKYSADELVTFFQFTAAKNISFPLIKVGIGASMIWCAIIIYQQNLPGTALIFFSGFLYLILEPLMLLSWIGVVTAQGFSSWKRIKKLLNDMNEPVSLKMSAGENLMAPQVEFWDNKLDLEFKPRAWNVILGDTGIGKSYVLEQFAFLLHQRGQKYSFIQQEPYLYNDTVVNNIFLGQLLSEEKLLRAKKLMMMFGLDVLGDNLDVILQMEVGENGKKLSGGQAKRLALIRSLLSDVDFILWDDPFSSVDFILEKQIINELKLDKFIQSKTFILTTHRLTTVKACDWVVFLGPSKNQIEMGTVQDKIFNKGRISDYFAKQII